MAADRFTLPLITVVTAVLLLSAMVLTDTSASAQAKKRAPARTAPAARPAPELQRFSFETVAVDNAGKVTNKQRAEAEYFVEELPGGVKLEMVKVPAGSFQMGSTEEQFERFKKEIERYCPKCDGAVQAKTELPLHRVNVPTFFISKYEITQAQYKALMKANPSMFKGNDLPVENVSWLQSDKFCKLLSQRSGRQYRLPTEAEWEYACRANSTADFAFGNTITPDLVNYDSNYPYFSAPEGKYRETTTPVGTVGQPNAFGIYDMHGNVYEWCQDIWHENYEGAPTDGSAWMTGGNQQQRVLRGGAWDVYASNCRSAYRLGEVTGQKGIGPSLGFRIVMVVNQ